MLQILIKNYFLCLLTENDFYLWERWDFFPYTFMCLWVNIIHCMNEAVPFLSLIFLFL